MKKLTFTLQGTLTLSQRSGPGKSAPFATDNYLLIAVLFFPPFPADAVHTELNLSVPKSQSAPAETEPWRVQISADPPARVCVAI